MIYNIIVQFVSVLAVGVYIKTASHQKLLAFAKV